MVVVMPHDVEHKAVAEVEGEEIEGMPGRPEDERQSLTQQVVMVNQSEVGRRSERLLARLPRDFTI